MKKVCKVDLPSGINLRLLVSWTDLLKLWGNVTVYSEPLGLYHLEKILLVVGYTDLRMCFKLSCFHWIAMFEGVVLNMSTLGSSYKDGATILSRCQLSPTSICFTTSFVSKVPSLMSLSFIIIYEFDRIRWTLELYTGFMLACDSCDPFNWSSEKNSEVDKNCLLMPLLSNTLIFLPFYWQY